MERIVFLNGIDLNGNEKLTFYFKILLALLQVPQGNLLPQTKTIYINSKRSDLLIQVLCMSTDSETERIEASEWNSYPAFQLMVITAREKRLHPESRQSLRCIQFTAHSNITVQICTVQNTEPQKVSMQLKYMCSNKRSHDTTFI